MSLRGPAPKPGVNNYYTSGGRLGVGLQQPLQPDFPAAASKSITCGNCHYPFNVNFQQNEHWLYNVPCPHCNFVWMLVRCTFAGCQGASAVQNARVRQAPCYSCQRYIEIPGLAESLNRMAFSELAVLAKQNQTVERLGKDAWAPHYANIFHNILRVQALVNKAEENSLQTASNRAQVKRALSQDWSTDLERNMRSFVERIEQSLFALEIFREEINEQFQHAEAARRTVARLRAANENDDGYTYGSFSQSSYFHGLVLRFEETLEQYERVMQDVEEYLDSASKEEPENLRDAMTIHHELFMAVAAEVAKVHSTLQVVKQEFLTIVRKDRSPDEYKHVLHLFEDAAESQEKIRTEAVDMTKQWAAAARHEAPGQGRSDARCNRCNQHYLSAGGQSNFCPKCDPRPAGATTQQASQGPTGNNPATNPGYTAAPKVGLGHIPVGNLPPIKPIPVVGTPQAGGAKTSQTPGYESLYGQIPVIGAAHKPS